MSFGDLLRKMREDKGMSQKDLAEKSGVSQSGIARYETGERIPDLDVSQALAKALGVKCSAFDGCTFEKIENRRKAGRPRLKPEE